MAILTMYNVACIYRSDPNRGLAYRPGQCVTSNCAISTERTFYSYYLPAHELGHTWVFKTILSKPCKNVAFYIC